MAKDTLELIAETSPMLKMYNKQLFIDWINRNLYDRANYDIKKSWFYYNGDMEFVMALNHKLSEEGKKALFDASTVRFYSKGVV